MKKFALAIFILLGCSSVMADESNLQGSENGKTEIWINAGMLSHHFDQSRNFREKNSGLGVEVAMSDTNSITGGYFQNSEDRASNYLGWVWKPWSIGPARIGLFGALVDGYAHANKGDFFPMILPVAILEYRAIGVNFFVIPKIGNRVAGAYVAQIKLRIW
jgi:hypothetical protein